MPNCAGSTVCFSRLWVLMRPGSRLRFAKPSGSLRSRSRFPFRNAQKLPTRNIEGKKRAHQEDVDSDYLFGNFLQLAVSRFGCGKPSVIKQTLRRKARTFRLQEIR